MHNNNLDIYLYNNKKLCLGLVSHSIVNGNLNLYSPIYTSLYRIFNKPNLVCMNHTYLFHRLPTQCTTPTSHYFLTTY